VLPTPSPDALAQMTPEQFEQWRFVVASFVTLMAGASLLAVRKMVLDTLADAKPCRWCKHTRREHTRYVGGSRLSAGLKVNTCGRCHCKTYLAA
jgi:hypothetical protein